jgi:hypothetical protein
MRNTAQPVLGRKVKKFQPMKKPICFVASARDYHAIDWYRSVKSLCSARRVFIATDLIESEGVKRLVDERDEVFHLFDLDRWLLDRQSRFANIWRNAIKVLTVPLVAYRLNALGKKLDSIFHAHSMYYIFLCWLARVDFIATPMGSDVLVRPENSKLYRLFTIHSLNAATEITVDSAALQKKIRELCGKDSHIIQNGIDSIGTRMHRVSYKKRFRMMSIRGMDSNYRIFELLQERNSADITARLDFIYPFVEEDYYKTVKKLLNADDFDYGRVSKEVMYQMFGESIAVFSIPISDSSPRSVYEAIFCGACVVVSDGMWVNSLPSCMRARVVVVDISVEYWFGNALRSAQQISSTPFMPSREALELFDEIEAMKMVCSKFYGEFFDV